ncbi:heme peroxidase, partial [Ancylostoma caninum]
MPNPRVISNVVHRDVFVEHGKVSDASISFQYSHMIMQFGQFLGHDITHAPLSAGPSGEALNCSRCDSFRTVSENCLPIPVPEDDPFFSPFVDGEPRCISFVRSVNGQRQLGPRSPLNQLTAFIDGSVIYGSTVCEADALRTNSGGMLRSTESTINPGSIPPQADDQSVNCQSAPRYPCFTSGDERVSQHPAVTALHSIFHGDHNRIVKELAVINPQWDDETLYQTNTLKSRTSYFSRDAIKNGSTCSFTWNGNRKVAQGTWFRKRAVLWVLRSLTSLLMSFCPNCWGTRWSISTIYGQKATVISKVGNKGIKNFCDLIFLSSRIRRELRRWDVSLFFCGCLSCRAFNGEKMKKNSFSWRISSRFFSRPGPKFHNITPPLDLAMNFEYADAVYDEENGGVESIILGLVSSSAMAVDRYMTDALRNFLFSIREIPQSGLDLAAINIMRGRDHGLPSYVAHRKLCGLSVPISFVDLSGDMSPSAVEALSSVYESVEDIELFSGVLTEIPLKGAMVGPTAACIIAEQFSRLKRCDRFHYENDGPQQFTPDQLDQIRQVTLSSVICSNHGSWIRKVQPDAFSIPDDITNAPTHCDNYHTLDLRKWVDQYGCPISSSMTLAPGESTLISPCTSCTCTYEGLRCRATIIHDCRAAAKKFSVAEM